MQVHLVKETHMILFQLLAIVASFPQRETMGSSAFEIVTHSPYIPDADYNYRRYDNGKSENLLTHDVHSGRDITDYGYKLDIDGNPMVEDEFNSLYQRDEGDNMNISLTSTEITPDTESTGTYKIPIDTESTESIEFSSTTASYDPGTTELDDVLGLRRLSSNVVASLLGR